MSDFLHTFNANPDDFPVFSQQSIKSERDGADMRAGLNETLSAFVSDTAGLIAELDGSSKDYKENPGLAIPNHVIYLDKSGRPCCWLVNIFWDAFAAEGADRPKSSFLNIDRRDWIRRSGAELFTSDYVRSADGSNHRLGYNDFIKENITTEQLAWIRAQYIPGGIEAEDAETIMATPASLDGKTICIVDEVSNSGATLKIAQWLIENAFRDVEVRGYNYWRRLSGFRMVGDEPQMLSAPVWYDHHNVYGRGCGILDEDGSFFSARYERFPNNKTRAKKFGAQVLSRYIDLSEDGPDAKGTDRPTRQLASEMKSMRRLYDAGGILFQPPSNYERARTRATIEAQEIRVTREKASDSYVTICDYLKSERVPL